MVLEAVVVSIIVVDLLHHVQGHLRVPKEFSNHLTALGSHVFLLLLKVSVQVPVKSFHPLLSVRHEHRNQIKMQVQEPIFLVNV